MDLHNRRVPNSTVNELKKRKRKGENSLKVVYISTPMKVRTSTARFRALVQQLTGKNSDIAEYMDTRGASASHEFHDDYELLANTASDHHRVMQSSISCDDMNVSTTTTTTTTSDSFVGPTDNVYAFQMEEQLARVFSSEYSCCDPSQLDVLGSYEDLIL